MIYDKITQTINDFLGDDFILSYANNHDFDFNSVVPEKQEEISYGITRVDSGTTTQLGDQPIRTEQMRIIVATPEKRDVFNKAVNNLRTLLTGLNQFVVQDAETNEEAYLLFGEYNDAQAQVINGVRWWISEVIFSANIYNAFAISTDTQISIGGNELKGLMRCNYTREFVIEPIVKNNNPVPQNLVNNIKKTLTINVIALKNDTLISNLMTNEDSITDYALVYNNGIYSRSFSALLAVLNEEVVMGDVIKLTLTFIRN